jgi:hypothetical protein
MKRLSIVIAGLMLALFFSPAAHAGLTPPIPQPSIGPIVTVPTLPPLPKHHLKRPDKVTAHFTAATDTSVLGASPRGVVTFAQHALNGTITARGHVRGLTPGVRYLTVPYSDGVCAPLPGATAFPSKSFTANHKGRATIDTTVNPRAINPAAAFNVRQTHSVSIRRVAATVNGTTNVPLAVTESCNTHPRHHH